MDQLTHDIPESARHFLQEWHDNSRSCITAHTSGSTGKPKTILLPKEMVLRSAIRSNIHFGITSSSRLHLALSADYIAGKMLIARALTANCKLTFESPSQYPLSDSADLSPIDLISLVGSQLSGLIENAQSRRLPEIRNLLLGGAPLNDQMRRLACSGRWTPWESYGMTETASHIALRRVTADNTLPFQTLPGISVSLDSDDCLAIDLGLDGTFHTRDVARLIDNRHFFILGRKDNVIISGGLKVHPSEVEEKIFPFIPDRRFYITSRKSDKWGDEVVLMIEGDPCELPDFHNIPLLNHERPKAVLFTPRFQLTASGKIIRRKPSE